MLEMGEINERLEIMGMNELMELMELAKNKVSLI